MINLPENKQLIIFDGVCNLCNNSVQYVIKQDKKDVFMFASLQSNVAKYIVDKFDVDTSKTDSILLYSNERGIKSKSTAVLHIAKHLGFPSNLSTVFLIVPPFVRNWVYDYVANNRYKWYGKKNECMIPSSEQKSKFIE